MSSEDTGPETLPRVILTPLAFLNCCACVVLCVCYMHVEVREWLMGVVLDFHLVSSGGQTQLLRLQAW